MGSHTMNLAPPVFYSRPLFIQYLSAILIIGVMLCSPSLSAQQQLPLSFGAFGDGPYNENEWPTVAKQVVQESNDPRTAFLVHLGDITKGTATLPEWYYMGVAGLLKISKKPVYVVIGDNEWNDLVNPDIGWQLWRKHFEGFHRNFEGTHDTVTQAAQPGNFAFVQNNVLIIGLSIVGGNVHDQDEWTRRHANNLAWVNECLDFFGDEVRAVVVCAQANPYNKENHGDFFDPFVERVVAYEKPVLYLHGDGHNYEHQAPWRAPNLVRVQIDSIGKNPPLLVTVTLDPDEPFIFNRNRTTPASESIAESSRKKDSSHRTRKSPAAANK